MNITVCSGIRDLYQTILCQAKTNYVELPANDTSETNLHTTLPQARLLQTTIVFRILHQCLEVVPSLHWLSQHFLIWVGLIMLRNQWSLFYSLKYVLLLFSDNGSIDLVHCAGRAYMAWLQVNWQTWPPPSYLVCPLFHHCPSMYYDVTDVRRPATGFRAGALVGLRRGTVAVWESGGISCRKSFWY